MDRSLPKNYQTVYAEIQLAGHGCHLNAYEVFLRLRERRAAISQTTVYRALERLVSMKLLDEVSAPNAQHVAYELASPAHAHFHCRVCGSLRDVELVLPQEQLLAHKDLQAVEIERTVTLFEGRCKSCPA